MVRWKRFTRWRAGGIAAVLLVGTAVMLLPSVRRLLGAEACTPPESEFCQNTQNAIDELQNHSNQDCRVLGDQAQERFDDEHSWANNFSEGSRLFIVSLEVGEDSHAGAPVNQGYSRMPNNTDTMPGNVAYNEADAAGSNGQYFRDLCG